MGMIAVYSSVPSRRSLSASVSVILLVFTLLSLGRNVFAQVSTERSPALKAAWAALWENDARKARTLFGASLAEDDKNLEARRGMILTDLLLCNERDVLEHLEKLSKTPGADLMDLLLARYYYVFVATHGNDHMPGAKCDGTDTVAYHIEVHQCSSFCHSICPGKEEID